MKLYKIRFRWLLKVAFFLFIGGTFHLGADTPPGFQNNSNISKVHIKEEMLTPATVIKKSYDEKLNLYQYRLSNNVRVNLKPMPLPQGSEAEASPRIAFRASFGRGELEMPNEQQSALAYVTRELFTYGGIKPRLTTLADTESNGTRLHLEFSISPDDFYFTGKTKTLKQLKYLLSEMRDYFITAPIYDEEVLENKVREAIEYKYSTLNANPDEVATDKVRWLLANGDWKFGYPPKDQAIGTTIEQIRSFLNKPLKESYLELSITGNFDVEECLNAVLQTIGTLPTRDKSRPYLKELRNVQFPQTPLEKTFFLDKGSNIKFGTIIMTWPTRTPTCDKWGGWYRALGTPIHWEMMSWKVNNGWIWYKRLGLNVLTEIISWRLGDGYKNEYHRLNHYCVINCPKVEYNNHGKFVLCAHTDPKEIDYVEQTLLQVIRDIRLKGISETEWEQAISRIIEKAYQEEQGITYWLDAIDRSQELPDLLMWQKTFKKMYDCLKRKKIETIAKEILDSQKVAIIKILPL